MFTKVIISVVIFILTFEEANALQYPIPVFNNVQLRYDAGKYKVIIGYPTMVEGGSWGAMRPERGIGTFAFHYLSGGERWGTTGPLGQVRANKYSTKSALSQAVYKKAWGSNGLIFREELQLSTPPDCIAYVEYSAAQGGILLDPVAEPGFCSPIPPVPAQCNITTSEILLDHKTINLDEVKTSKTESDFIINCSMAGKVKFSLLGDEKIILGSGSSDIRINNLPLKSDINVTLGNNILKISSTLKNVGPGTWKSSAVLVMEQY